MKKAITGQILKVLLMVFMAGLFLGNMALAAGNEKKTDTVNSAEKININVATLKELIALPGIGKKKAGAIIAYRTRNGEFNSIDDLGKVKGIGKKILEKIKPYVTVKGG